MLSKHLHANALGKLMLAYLPDVHPEPDLRRLTEFTICDPDELTRHLRAVMLDGFAHECQESREAGPRPHSRFRCAIGRITSSAGCICTAPTDASSPTES